MKINENIHANGCITAQPMDSGAMAMAHWPSWARIAVVGEQLGTQRTVPHAPRATDGDLRAAQCAIADLSRALDAERAELAQLRRYNEGLVQMCIARVGERDAALAELTTLRADWQKLMATSATTPQTPPAPTPRDPWANALRRQHQVVGLLTERQR